MRLFAAVYPDAAALDHLELALAAVGRDVGPAGRGAGAGQGQPVLRWTPRPLLHVTTSFYGEVPDGAAPELVVALARVAGDAPSMRLRLQGAGVFDRRVLWAGVAGETSALQRLCGRSAEAADEVGLRPDRRPRQRAHLTVARATAAARRAERRPRRGGPAAGTARDALDGPASALSVYAGPTWTVRELCLVESDRSDHSGRVVHRVLERLPLGG